MELTNYSFLESRRNYLSAHRGVKVHANRIATGEKINGPAKDLGALGMEARFSSVRKEMNHNRTNLQSYITHLDSQMGTVQQVPSIYDRMSVLAHRSMDPMLSEFSTASTSGDKSLLDTEFQELRKNLDDILKHSINNQKLFGGNSADFSDALADTSNSDSTPTRTDPTDIGTLSSGVLELSFSPGGMPDGVWIFEGSMPAFGKDNGNNVVDFEDKFTNESGDNNTQLIQALDNLFQDQGIFSTGSLTTAGNAGLNYDNFKIDLGACDATDPSFLSYDGSTPTSQFGRRLPTGSDTNIVIVAVNFNNNKAYQINAAFNPSLPKINLTSPSTGQNIPSMSFGALKCKHVDTAANARDTLTELDEELKNLSQITATLAAEKNRHLSELEHLRTEETHYEAVGSRISDADIAKEATLLAKSSLKMSLAEQVMSKSAHLKDVLIPLTTNHHRGAMLNATL